MTAVVRSDFYHRLPLILTEVSALNLAQEMERIVYDKVHQSSSSLAEVSGVTDLDKDDFWLTFLGQLSIILRF